jgi:hypothetical protein
LVTLTFVSSQLYMPNDYNNILYCHSITVWTKVNCIYVTSYFRLIFLHNGSWWAETCNRYTQCMGHSEINFICQFINQNVAYPLLPLWLLTFQTHPPFRQRKVFRHLSSSVLNSRLSKHTLQYNNVEIHVEGSGIWWIRLLLHFMTLFPPVWNVSRDTSTVNYSPTSDRVLAESAVSAYYDEIAVRQAG